VEIVRGVVHMQWYCYKQSTRAAVAWHARVLLKKSEIALY
jgi:hypothetical protein